MIRTNDIVTALTGLVGIGSEGTSGLDVCNAHPLLTPENIEAIAPLELNGNTQTQNEFAAGVIRAGITQVVQRFLSDKQIYKQSRDLLQRKPFFDGAGRIKNTITNTHKIVGLEIVPVRGMGVTTQIEKIGLQFANAVEDSSSQTVELYLFHSSRSEAVRQLSATIKGDGRFAWITPKVPLMLPYFSTNVSSDVAVQISIDPKQVTTTDEGTSPGGSWYLVYNQDDLPLGWEAINVSKDWSREPCGTCNIGSLQDWRELTKYLQITPFMVGAPENWEQNPRLWDVSEMMYTNTQSYGMNCVVSVGCDISDFIISQKDAFANVIQLQTAYNLLRSLALNPNARVNRNQLNAARGDILYELDGNTAGRPTGLGVQLERAYKALRISTEGIDRICLACANKGVNYGMV